MSFSQVPAGRNIPHEINVIIEIPAFAPPIKYEIDKETEVVWVDRLQATTMSYPANYGYINQTLANDGDPVDVLVVTPHPLMVGCVIPARPIGMLKMTDDGGEDSKIIAVPTSKMTPIYDHVEKVEDLPLIKEQTEHFFSHYKDLEAGKWVKIEGWEDANAARKEILDAWERYCSQQS